MTETPVVRVGVVTIVWREDRRLLIGLRTGPHGYMTWGMPGGHVEFGEEPEQAAVRELKEETDLSLHSVRPYRECPWLNTHFPESGKQYITLYFEGVALHPDEVKVMEPDKWDRWEWRSPADMPSPLFKPIDLGRLNLTKPASAPRTTSCGLQVHPGPPLARCPSCGKPTEVSVCLSCLGKTDGSVRID